MPVQKYDSYLQINPSFESVVDLAADERNSNLWREYIVGDDMEKLMEYLCQTLNYEAPDSRRSLWIHGSYGTGKSYAAILIKHLLEEKQDVVSEYLQSSMKLSKFHNRFIAARKKGEHLVIWKYGCTGIRTGEHLLVEIEFAIRERLREKFGDAADYGSTSLQDAVKAQLANRNINWENVFDSSILSENYGSLEQVRHAVESGDLKATKAVAEIIRANHWGLIDNVDTFKKWIEEIIAANHLEKSGIFFIWDEFTDYIRYGDDQVILQQLSEFCKEQPLFMCFIVHKDSSWVDVMGNAKYQQITHRFHEVEFHVSADAAFDLIAGSISIRNGMKEHWSEERQVPISNIKRFLPDIAGLDDRVSEKIADYCPMHPMTVKLLSRVAESFAASQRTMFRFMKDITAEDSGFVGYIAKYGPQDQFNWLTPDWLWDYFFTQESDFHDKDTKVPEYIRHYEESRHLVENDESAICVFKTAMLLMAIMSTAKGIGTQYRAGTISATVECLENCLAGVITKAKISDYLATFSDSKILMCDELANGTIRLQLPFRLGGADDFQPRYDMNDKKYTRYQMFSKDGKIAAQFEKMASVSDALSHRLKIAICCAETTSIEKRLREVTDELDKYPYKLGILFVSVKDEAQALSIQQSLATKAADLKEKRLTIALVRTPFTDEMRKSWLTSITKAEMARESGHSGDANRYETEATTIVTRWASAATSGSKITAWFGEVQNTDNIFGTANLRKNVQKLVLESVFPYAPETIVATETAYKSCNDGAPLAGIQRATKNSQLMSVLGTLKQMSVEDVYKIDELAGISGSTAAASVAALAEFIKERMESGSKVILDDLWRELQQPPFGYYNSIACGVLLGFVFSCYKDTGFSWTDSTQGTFVLDENHLKTMVYRICRGEMSTDYLSEGSRTWQNFRDYLKRIFKLTDGQVANEIEGMRSVRECVTAAGAPFWVLKYLQDDEYGGVESKNIACSIVDNIQVFISQDGNTDDAMSTALQLLNSRGKLRERLMKAFHDKAVMARAFNSFLFDASPELKAVSEQLSIQPQDLCDKVFRVMQNAIYTWTEDQVRDKLADVVSEYRYLAALNSSMRNTYHSTEEALKDLRNAFAHMRIAILAIEPLGVPWYEAICTLRRAAKDGVMHLAPEVREADIGILQSFGTAAWEHVVDAKPVLALILEHKQQECTSQELDSIYVGLKDVSCDASVNQFDKELNTQIGRISQARNRSMLLELWKTISSTESIKEWCTAYGIPLLWIIPRDAQSAFSTLISVQRNERTVDQYVINAINYINGMDVSIFTDKVNAEAAFMQVIGDEYQSIFDEKREQILAELKQKLGNDISMWTVQDIARVQQTLKRYQVEKAKKEKLQKTQNSVKTMDDAKLRSKVTAFLSAHPEFCDDFN